MRLDENLRFTIQMGEEKNPVLILRQPTARELKTFLQGRFVRKGNKIQDVSVEARENFVNALLERVENVEVKGLHGGYVEIMTLPDWKDRIPLNWKTSIAIKFEEAEVVSQEEAGESVASSTT